MPSAFCIIYSDFFFVKNKKKEETTRKKTYKYKWRNGINRLLKHFCFKLIKLFQGKRIFMGGERALGNFSLQPFKYLVSILSIKENNTYLPGQHFNTTNIIC